MNKKLISLLLGLFLTVMVAPVQAVPTLSWTVADLGSSNWQYSYRVDNDLSGLAIDSVTIDFAYGLYEVLQVDSLPAGWGSSSAIDPQFTSTGFQNGNFFGFAGPGNEIASGSSLDGFAVSFAWLGSDPPMGSLDGLRAAGDQAFTYTTVPAAPVPEPGTLLLLTLGLAGVAGCRRILHR